MKQNNSQEGSLIRLNKRELKCRRRKKNRISDKEYQQGKGNIKKAKATVNKLEEKVHKVKNLKEKK